MLAFLAGIAAEVPCPDASAQSVPNAAPDTAGELYADAKRMMASGNFGTACPKLAQSEALDPQVGTMLNLALCYESTGKIASSCSWWRAAAEAAARKSQSDRELYAKEQAESLCPHAPQVTVDVAPQKGREQIEVMLNETRVPREQWGVPWAVDPGEYEVRATGEGVRPWSSKLVVDATGAPQVLVPVLALPEPLLPEAPAPVASTGAGLKTAGWITGGAGLALAGIGGAFGVAAILNVDASRHNGECVGNICNDQGRADRQRGIEDGYVADVALGVGAAAVAAGVALWVAGSHPPKAMSNLRFEPRVGRSSGSLSLVEAW